MPKMTAGQSVPELNLRPLWRGQSIDKNHPGRLPGPWETKMNTHKLSAVLLAGVAGGTLLLSATAAGAAVARPHGPASGREAAKNAPVLSAASRIPAALPKGYTVVTSTFTAFAGAQDADQTNCPGTRQPVGGGAFVSSSDLQVNLNRSYPWRHSWIVSVGNASASSTPVTAYVICMAHSASYKVVQSAAASVSPESVNSQAAVCPAHTVVTGGGAVPDSAATDVNINSTVPNTFAGGRTGWRVAMASSDPSSVSFTVYAVCRPKPVGYSIQWGLNQQLQPYSEGAATVTCPGASVPIGGGGFTGYSTQDAWITMNSSGPDNQGWVVYENNDENVARSLDAAVICAGT